MTKGLRSDFGERLVAFADVVFEEEEDDETHGGASEWGMTREATFCFSSSWMGGLVSDSFCGKTQTSIDSIASCPPSRHSISPSFAAEVLFSKCCGEAESGEKK